MRLGWRTPFVSRGALLGIFEEPEPLPGPGKSLSPNHARMGWGITVGKEEPCLSGSTSPKRSWT